MRFRTKQVVDFWLGGFLLLLLFLPVRGLGLLLRRDHSLARRRGCVIVKMVGAGSLFLATPSLQSIRGKFPDGGFFLVGTKAVTGFAEGFEWFDECWTIDDSSLWRFVSTSLRALYKIAQHCDHLIDLEVHSRLTVVFAVLSTVRNRIGFVDDAVFWRRGFYTHMNYFNSQGPVYAFYDTLASWFEIDRVLVAPVNAAFSKRVLATPLPETLTLPPRYVVVAPGCSEFGKERQLRPDEWRSLLTNAPLNGAAVVLLGAAADRQLCDAIITELGFGHDLSGQLSIAQSAAVLARAEHFYGIDSLLLHLARALNVPATSVWGPSDPTTRLRPGPGYDRVYYSKTVCSPCIHVHDTPPCNGARVCIPAALAKPSRPLNAPALESTIGWVIGPREPSYRVVEVSHDLVNRLERLRHPRGARG
jgi:ADP-heptose:LPS heptosyltransferase